MVFGIVGCSQKEEVIEEYFICVLENTYSDFEMQTTKETYPKLYDSWISGFKYKYTGDKFININDSFDNGDIIEFNFEYKDEFGYRYFSLDDYPLQLSDDTILLMRESAKFHPVYKELIIKTEVIEGWNESLEERLSMSKISEVKGNCLDAR